MAKKNLTVFAIGVLALSALGVVEISKRSEVNVEASSPTLKEEVLYSESFDGMTGSSVDEIWGQTQMFWYQDVTPSIIDNGGKNSLQCSANNGNEYVVLGGIGSGGTGNLSKLVVGQTYTFTTYLDVADVSDGYELYIEPQCGAWTGIKFTASGATSLNGSTTSNVSYVNKVLSFDFTVTGTSTADLYAKITMHYFGNGGKAIFDDFKITRQRATFTNYDSATSDNIPYFYNSGMDSASIVTETSGNKYLKVEAANAEKTEIFKNFYLNNLPVEDNQLYRLSFDVVEKGYTEFYIRYNDNVVPCALMNQETCYAVDSYDYIKGASFDGTHVTFDFIPSSTVNENWWHQVYIIVKAYDDISFGIDNFELVKINGTFAATEELQIGVGENIDGKVTGTLTYAANDVRNVSASEINLDTTNVKFNIPGEYIATASIVDEFGIVYTDNVAVKVGNVSITKPTLKPEDVYAADYSSFDVDTTADGVWQEEQLLWFEGNCVDVSIKEHDGANMLEYVNKCDGGFTTLGGIGSGSTGNLSALVPNQTYRFQAYVDVASEADWTLYIEPQCREWTGINLKSSGAAAQNAATTTNVSYVNKVLSFDFTVTEPVAGMDGVYAKMVGQNFAIGDKIYFDDISISKVRANSAPGVATVIDYESATVGTVQNPNQSADIPNCWNASMDQGISIVEDAGNKYLQAKASNAGQGNEWHNFYINGLSFLQDNTPYRLSFDVVEKGYDEFYIRYNDNVTPCASMNQDTCYAIDEYDYILGATFDGTHVTFDFIPSSAVNANFWQQIYIVVKNNTTISFGIDNVKFEPLSSVIFEACDVEIDVDGDLVSALNGSLSYSTTDVRIVTGSEMVYDAEEVDVTKVGTYNVTVYIADEYMNVYEDKIQVKVHKWDEGVVTKEATCEEDGIRTYTCECGETKIEVIPAINHNYGEVSYTWSEDNKQVTATKVCANDASHVITETVDATYEVVTAAGCETKGEGKYTATFATAGFEAQTKTVEIEAIDHNYGEVSYTWSEDNKQVTATKVCANDASHIITETVDATYEVVTAAGCETKGEGKYTATFTTTGFEAQTKTVEINALGHDYELVVEVEATYDATGVKEHYTCKYEGCTKLFVKQGDEYVEVKEADLVIPKKEKPVDPDPQESSSTSESEKQSESSSQVESSSTTSEEKKDSSSNSDNTNKKAKKGCGSAAIPSMVGLLALAGALVISKKRK